MLLLEPEWRRPCRLSRLICTTMGECLSAGFRAALAGCLMVAVLLGTAVAGPLENASAALQRGDYATVRRIIQSLADQGDAVAQWRLGRMYYYGLGVPLEWAETLRWYRKAAEQGHAAAQYDLGNMYYRGLGVPPENYDEALKWYREAAKQGPRRGAERPPQHVLPRPGRAAELRPRVHVVQPRRRQSSVPKRSGREDDSRTDRTRAEDVGALLAI
jgi:tetratricopeptide (TPR) repeat protein